MKSPVEVQTTYIGVGLLAQDPTHWPSRFYWFPMWLHSMADVWTWLGGEEIVLANGTLNRQMRSIIHVFFF
jgi:hypothetical protein